MDNFVNFPFQKQKKNPNSNKPTKVLLLCVKNKANCLLSQTYIYNLFSKYGIPKKVFFIPNFFSQNANFFRKKRF